MIYTKPANDIGWDDVDSFCQEGIPEGAHLDYKRDFPSNLEKTIAAMANTLGGVILIGVEEDDESKPKLPLRGVKFQKGLSERVTSIILSNVTPPVFPDIAVCRNSDGDKAVVVIRVPQSHQTPHAINRNTQVYLRTGNRNSPEDLARIDEIEWLREHRRKSEDLRDQIYRRAIDRFQVIHQREFDRLKSKNSKLEQRQEGVIETSICPLYPKDSLKDPPALREILSKMLVPEYYQSQYAYFPLPYDSVPKIMQDGISATMIDQYSDVYHTQLTTTGLFYYRQSAGTSEQGVGKVIYATEIFARLDQFWIQLKNSTKS